LLSSQVSAEQFLGAVKHHISQQAAQAAAGHPDLIVGYRITLQGPLHETGDWIVSKVVKGTDQQSYYSLSSIGTEETLQKKVPVTSLKFPDNYRFTYSHGRPHEDWANQPIHISCQIPNEACPNKLPVIVTPLELCSDIIRSNTYTHIKSPEPGAPWDSEHVKANASAVNSMIDDLVRRSGFTTRRNYVLQGGYPGNSSNDTSQVSSKLGNVFAVITAMEIVPICIQLTTTSAAGGASSSSTNPNPNPNAKDTKHDADPSSADSHIHCLDSTRLIQQHANSFILAVRAHGGEALVAFNLPHTRVHATGQRQQTQVRYEKQ